MLDRVSLKRRGGEGGWRTHVVVMLYIEDEQGITTPAPQ